MLAVSVAIVVVAIAVEGGVSNGKGSNIFLENKASDLSLRGNGSESGHTGGGGVGMGSFVLKAYAEVVDRALNFIFGGCA